MVKNHNDMCKNNINTPRFSPLHIKKHVFFTGYLIDEAGTKLLLETFPIMTAEDDEVRVLANNITITPRRAPYGILSKVGGIGQEYRFEVVATGNSEDRVWAAQVRPVDPSVKAYTESGKLMVVLGYRRGAKPGDASQINRWSPVSDHQRVQFTSKVGEKLLLKLESEEESSQYERSRTSGSNYQNNRPNHHFNNSNNNHNYNNHNNHNNHNYNNHYTGHHNNSGHYNQRENHYHHQHNQGYQNHNEQHGFTGNRGRGRGGDRGGYRGNHKRRGGYSDDEHRRGGYKRREFYDRDRVE